MERAFQTALWLLRPEVVFILGDIFDEGKWSSQKVKQSSLFSPCCFVCKPTVLLMMMMMVVVMMMVMVRER